MSSDLEQIEYRTLSPLAVVGLVFGLCAPLAFLSPLLVVVPVVGMVVSLLAIRQIAASDGSIVGRGAACAGLVISTICATAIPVQSATMQWLANRQAKPIAEQWFELLAKDDPYSAFELTLPPQERHPLGAGLPDFYASDETAYDRLKEFVSDPNVRALLALGDRATVRYYESAGFGRLRGGRLQTANTYAVTYRESEGSKPTTFFVQLAMEKEPTTPSAPGGWRVLDYRGRVQPRS